MRKMKITEIDHFIKNFGWATLCMADSSGQPYAIEYSYFLDGDEICGLVHASGRTSQIIAENNRVCLKICEADRYCKNYTAVSCFGTARYEKLTDKIEVAAAWDAMENQLEAYGKYEVYKKKYLREGKTLPVLRITVTEKTGITSRPR